MAGNIGEKKVSTNFWLRSLFFKDRVWMFWTVSLLQNLGIRKDIICKRKIGLK